LNLRPPGASGGSFPGFPKIGWASFLIRGGSPNLSSEGWRRSRITGVWGGIEGRQIGVFEKSEQAVVRNEADAALAASRSVGKAFYLAGGDQLIDRASAKSGYFDGLGDSDPFRLDIRVAWLAVGRGYFAHRGTRISKAFAIRFLVGI